MPGLVFGGRRLLLGGDELMLPYAASACGRTGWVLFLSTGVILATRALLLDKCPRSGYLLLLYAGASIAVGALSLVVELRIAKASALGTIIDPGPRNRLLGKYLSQKAMLGAVQLLLGLGGVVLTFYVPLATPCEASLGIIMGGIVLIMISQFIDSGGMYCCFLAFTTADSIWIHYDEDEELVPRYGVLAEMEMRWEQFCRTACKWLAWCSCTFNVFGGGAQEADFAHVSRVFSRMLSARRFVDVVATDIAAGLILLRHVQKSEDYKRRDELRGGPGTPYYSTITRDPSLVESDAEASFDGDAGGGQAARNRGHTGAWGVECPSCVPLHERSKKHRKFYKVSRDERVMDVSRGGEDFQLLQETAHFVRYANVMYSVWGTFVVDPWSGVRRMIRRSASWCPRFRARRGQRRSSVWDAQYTGGGTGNRDSVVSGVSSFGEHDTEGEFGDGGRQWGQPFYGTHFREADVRGDNCWGSHETALRAELPEGAELVLANFVNGLDETPYCVAIDHNWQSIVITIRGTHSFEDFLVDAMAEPQSMDHAGKEWGFDGSGMHAHEGILRRAEWIRRDLENCGVLRLLLGDVTVQDGWGLGDTTGASAVEDARHCETRLGTSSTSGVKFSSRVPLASAVEGSGFCAGYTVRTVGHSLGAGCAALLTLLLKPTYPSVKGLAVSPPGGLVSEGACRKATEALVTSLVLNDDVVPRMSSQSIELLADQVLEVLGRSRVSKLFVMRSLLRYEEDVHRPELYLEPADDGSWIDIAPISRDRPMPSANSGDASSATPVGPAGPTAVEMAEAGSPSEVANEGSGGGKELKYHRQLQRYREHLQEQGGSRYHFHRLRLPGRILHLVNTDFSTESVDLRCCETGCVLWCCSLCAPRSSHEDELGTCCCTTRKGWRRKRVFTPVWSSPNDLAEIRVTPAFLVDHSPDEILKAMEQMMEDLGVCV